MTPKPSGPWRTYRPQPEEKKQRPSKPAPFPANRRSDPAHFFNHRSNPMNQNQLVMNIASISGEG